MTAPQHHLGDQLGFRGRAADEAIGPETAATVKGPVSRRVTSWQVLFGLVLLLVSGCTSIRFSAPPTGVLPSGEALSVREVTTAHTTLEQRQVGTVEYKDSSGKNAGSASVYEAVPVTNYQVNWFLFQGQNTIDDADFYGIAGNLEARTKAQSYRSSGILFTWLGLGLSVAGLTTTAALSLAEAGPLGYSGLIGAIAGAVLAIIGQYRLAPEHHVFDSVTAINTANSYNQSLRSPRSTSR